MKKTITRILGVLLVFFTVLSCFFGCSKKGADKKTLINEINRDFGGEGSITEFTAEAFAQQASLSWCYSYNVKVEGENIYFNDVLYNSVENVDAPILSYEKAIFLSCNKTVSNDTVSEALEKIENSTSCYILTSDDKNKYGDKIAVYQIEDTYYFISFLDNDVMLRVHYAKIS